MKQQTPEEYRKIFSCALQEPVYNGVTKYIIVITNLYVRCKSTDYSILTNCCHRNMLLLINLVHVLNEPENLTGITPLIVIKTD